MTEALRTAARAVASGAAILALAFGGGCSVREEGKSPESAVRLLIAAARAGDRNAVYGVLGSRTRARLDELAAAAGKQQSARRLWRPVDFVSVGWAPPAWEAAGVRTIRRDDDDGEVEVYSAAGDRQAVHLVREGKLWKVELSTQPRP